jgi:hypothetical protein
MLCFWVRALELAREYANISVPAALRVLALYGRRSQRSVLFSLSSCQAQEAEEELPLVWPYSGQWQSLAAGSELRACRGAHAQSLHAHQQAGSELL